MRLNDLPFTGIWRLPRVDRGDEIGLTHSLTRPNAVSFLQQCHSEQLSSDELMRLNRNTRSQQLEPALSPSAPPVVELGKHHFGRVRQRLLRCLRHRPRSLDELRPLLDRPSLLHEGREDTLGLLRSRPLIEHVRRQDCDVHVLEMAIPRNGAIGSYARELFHLCVIEFPAL